MLRSGLVPVALCFLGLLAIASCTQKKNEPEVPRPQAELLSEHGRQVYLTNCIACHNPNPTQNGAVGPAISGSSLELLSARILDASYPAGYKPKRDSKAMSALPQLRAEIPALHAYLSRP